jgi:hypothetical protein
MLNKSITTKSAVMFSIANIEIKVQTFVSLQAKEIILIL